MISYLIVILSLVSIFIGYKYRNILKYLPSITKIYICNQIKNIKNKYFSNSSFKHNEVEIYYNHDDTKYKIHLPFCYLNKLHMSSIKVYLIYHNDEIKDITHTPGIPYLINANIANCKYIKAHNIETDQIHEYHDEDVPLYCVEVHYTE